MTEDAPPACEYHNVWFDPLTIATDHDSKTPPILRAKLKKPENRASRNRHTSDQGFRPRKRVRLPTSTEKYTCSANRASALYGVDK